MTALALEAADKLRSHGTCEGRDAALIESDAELIARLRGIVGLAGAAIMVRDVSVMMRRSRAI